MPSDEELSGLVMEEQILAAESKRRRCLSLFRKRPVRSGEDWFVIERLPCLQLKMARAASLCVCKEGLDMETGRLQGRVWCLSWRK